MKSLISIWIVIVLLGLLFISLLNLDEYGASGLILAAISAFALYKVFKFVFEEDDAGDERGYTTPVAGKPVSRSDPLQYIFFSDIGDSGDGDD